MMTKKKKMEIEELDRKIAKTIFLGIVNASLLVTLIIIVMRME